MYQYENLDDRAKERIRNRYLIGSITNVGVILVSTAFLLFYAFPNYTNQSATIDSVNGTLQSLQTEQQNGMEVGAIKSAMRGNTKFDKNTVDALFRNPEKLRLALEKPKSFSGDYLSYMNGQLADLNDANTAVENKERIL